MNLLTILLYVLGGALISAGIAIIVLMYATKVFFTKVTSIKAGAGDPGLDLYKSAFIVWDETYQEFNSSTQNFSLWKSNSTYADINNVQNKYTLKPRSVAPVSYRVSNSGTKGIVLSETVASSNYDLINNNQSWILFPTSNFTIVLAGSGPSTEIPANSVSDGMGFRYGGAQFGLAFNYSLTTSKQNAVVISNVGATSVQPIQDRTSFQTYTITSGQTYSANTFGITYTTSTDKTCKTYLNGNKITFDAPDTSTIAVTPTDQLRNPLTGITNSFQIGSDQYSSTTSAYFAILVFNRILNDAEMFTLNRKSILRHN
uniref:Lectin/glucanase superfamily protein n=1 Tax=viral metagenome TaxID=1070528 RepID=A0A6C0CLC5_9ZZZZ